MRTWPHYLNSSSSSLYKKVAYWSQGDFLLDLLTLQAYKNMFNMPDLWPVCSITHWPYGKGELTNVYCCEFGCHGKRVCVGVDAWNRKKNKKKGWLRDGRWVPTGKNTGVCQTDRLTNSEPNPELWVDEHWDVNSEFLVPVQLIRVSSVNPVYVNSEVTTCLQKKTLALGLW